VKNHPDVGKSFLFPVVILAVIAFIFGVKPASAGPRASDEVIEQRSQVLWSEAQQISPKKTRRSIWGFGLSGQKLTLKSGDEYEVLGNQVSIQIGTGYFAKSWYFLGSLDFTLGPYEPIQNQQIDADFVGTGATLWTGFSAQTLDLRSSAGGYGFALGLNYGDIMGRSTGRNRRDDGKRQADGKPTEDNLGLIDSYSIRITNFSIIPALFFSWLDEARPLGNSKDLLSTRIEGYILTFGLAVPMDTTYSAKAILTDKSVKNGTGHLRGYTLLVTWSTILST
jgi:hypothetical protein